MEEIVPKIPVPHWLVSKDWFTKASDNDPDGFEYALLSFYSVSWYPTATPESES